MTYDTTTLATAKNEKLIFRFFDQPYPQIVLMREGRTLKKVNMLLHKLDKVVKEDNL